MSASDVREALAFALFRREYVYASDAWAEATWPRNEELRLVYQEKADAVLEAFEVRPRGTVTDAAVEAGAIALHAEECSDDTCDHILNEFEASSRVVLEAAREVHP